MEILGFMIPKGERLYKMADDVYRLCRQYKNEINQKKISPKKRLDRLSIF